MFLHAISPSRAFTKVSKALINDTRLDPAARLLLAHLSGLKPADELLPLSAYAAKLGIKCAAYKRIKKELVQYGYVHDHRQQGPGGRWFTDQWVSNVPLTEDQFTALRTDGRQPTVGQPSVRPVGRSTGTSKTDSKTSPTHPPQEPTAEAAAEAAVSTPQGTEPEDSQFAVAERMLRQLGHTRKDLALSFRNARYLASAVAAQLRRGVPVWEVQHALTHALPDSPIRNSAGFVTHRLRDKVADPLGPAHDATLAKLTADPLLDRARPRPAVECQGPGRPYAHVFRPIGDETLCDGCRRDYPQIEECLVREDGGEWAPIGTGASHNPPPF
ncbi:hypothetical protein ACIQM4_14515 [Streptomyces sp. NPDC091272]|uniref:hypothetical protein n=1 Tax=Streptomyces sp. NPDC091272 TaxID=3365981 RepID=UPI0038034CAF